MGNLHLACPISQLSASPSCAYGRTSPPRTPTLPTLVLAQPTVRRGVFLLCASTQGIEEEQRLHLKEQVEQLGGKVSEREKHERERALAIK